MDLALAADILIATWRVSQPGRTLPQGQGQLDAALKIAIERGAFPPEFKQLTFIESPFRVYCPDLLSIFDLANMTLMISTPNPTYSEARVNLSIEAAGAILEEHGIPLETACEWGATLAQALDRDSTEAI